jgi:hypothetical protein
VSTRPSLFATTRWTIVGQAAGADDSRAVEAMAALFEAYWPQLYR